MHDDCAGSAVQALVQGLETSVLYEFWMQATTSAGHGQTTDVIRIITPSDVATPGRSSMTLIAASKLLYMSLETYDTPYISMQHPL